MSEAARSELPLGEVAVIAEGTRNEFRLKSSQRWSKSPR